MESIFKDAITIALTFKDEDTNVCTVYLPQGTFYNTLILLFQAINKPNMDFSDAVKLSTTLTDHEWIDNIKQVIAHQNEAIKKLQEQEKDQDDKDQPLLLSVFTDEFTQREMIENTRARVIVDIKRGTVDYSQLFITNDSKDMKGLISGLGQAYGVNPNIGVISDLTNNAQISHISLEVVMQATNQLVQQPLLQKMHYLALQTQDKKKIWFFVNLNHLYN